jgi:uncharacterized protein YjbJ (UPF0337 family)
MGLPNSDELKGKLNQAKGVVKEHVGRATGDENLQGEGLDDQAGGAFQAGVGQVRRKAGDALSDLGKKLRK